MKLERFPSDLSELRQALESKQDCEWGRGASESEIREYETALGISFPESYKQFLRLCGYLVWLGQRVRGISQAATYGDVRVGTEERRMMSTGTKYSLPTSAVVLDDDFIMLCSPPNACKVVMWPPEPGCDPAVYDSFEDYFCDKVNNF